MRKKGKKFEFFALFTTNKNGANKLGAHSTGIFIFAIALIIYNRDN